MSPSYVSNSGIAAFAFVFASCSQQSDLSASIERQFTSSGGKSVVLAKAIPSAWGKVCILGPYANNDSAKNALGFEWNVEANTSIKDNEGITVLIFAQGNRVAHFTEHPRHKGDFSNLSGRCFSKEASSFVHVSLPKKGWPGLFPKNET